DRRLLGTFLPGYDHVRLEEHPLEPHALRVERVEDTLEHLARELRGAAQWMRPAHENLGLDDGDEPGFLRERRVAAERMGVHLDAGVAPEMVAHTAHRPPPPG